MALLAPVLGLGAAAREGRDQVVAPPAPVEVERAEVRARRAPPVRTRGVRLPSPRPPVPIVGAGAGPVTAQPPAPVPTADQPPAAPAPPSPEPAQAAPVNQPPPRPERAAPAPPGGPPPTVSEGSDAVYPDDFPDPFVMRANGAWWAFATQVGFTQLPVMRSDDLVSWEPVGDALRGPPDWAEWGHSWAPSVVARGSTFVLYYSTRHRDTGLQCLSRAVAVLPQGPYVDSSSAPLVCQTELGGSIDPSPFVDDDGRAWLLWKSEGTLQGEPTRLWVQELSGDGQRLLGEPVELLHRALPWEHPIIEAPSMVRVGGRYHLVYSGNRWEGPDYAVGHAVCDSVVGPCRRTSLAPILRSRQGAAGPGGQELLRLPDGELALVHHAWDPAAVGYPHGARMLHLAKLRVDGDRLVVGGPLRERRPSGLVDLGR